MKDEPIKPIDLSLSPQTKAYIEFLVFCKKQFEEYVSKNIGCIEEQNGISKPRNYTNQ